MLAIEADDLDEDENMDCDDDDDDDGDERDVYDLGDREECENDNDTDESSSANGSGEGFPEVEEREHYGDEIAAVMSRSVNKIKVRQARESASKQRGVAGEKHSAKGHERDVRAPSNQQQEDPNRICGKIKN